MITKDDVRRDILAICDANPEGVNPRVIHRDGTHGVCAYNKYEGDTTPGSQPHCLAGTYLVQHDLPLPVEGHAVDGREVQGSYLDRMVPGALHFLASVQTMADRVVLVGPPKITRSWGEVAEMIRRG